MSATETYAADIIAAREDGNALDLRRAVAAAWAHTELTHEELAELSGRSVQRVEQIIRTAGWFN